MSFGADDLTKPPKKGLYVPQFKVDVPQGYRFYTGEPLVSRVDRWATLDMNAMLAEEYGGVWRQPNMDEWAAWSG